MRWYVGLGAFLLVFAICVTIAAYAGLWPFMILRGIQLAILFPFSLVILILSMFISSSITGGIDFGEVQTAVPKAIMLLVLVDSVALVPIYGMFLTFPVWIFGLMAFFQLDIWEARVMIAINWVGNTLVQFFLLAIIITAIQHIGEKDHDDQPIDQPPAIQQQDDRVPGPGQNEMEK